ncbi:MAG TPA: hypothetical protein VGC87_12565 [Pyrinomonadaceae bacterium]|jgi:hypothetical protein
MRHENLFARMSYLLKEIDRINKENPTGPDEETDPRIVELLKEGMEVQQELDPLVRETFRNNPARLAEWDDIMHMCDDLDQGDVEESAS